MILRVSRFIDELPGEVTLRMTDSSWRPGKARGRPALGPGGPTRRIPGTGGPGRCINTQPACSRDTEWGWARVPWPTAPPPSCRTNLASSGSISGPRTRSWRPCATASRKIVPTDRGNLILPSVVALSAKGDLLVGGVAKDRWSPTPRTPSGDKAPHRPQVPLARRGGAQGLLTPTTSSRGPTATPP